MSQMARVMRLALVAMLFVVVLTSSQVSADRVAHQPRNAHPGLRKAMFGRRSTMMPDPSDPDCPEGEENGPAHLQEVAQRLADTSEKDGGKEETYDAVVPGPQDETHVDVRARSEVGKSGSHRSWSWSSSTHSSSHSSSSSSFNSSSSSSSSTSSDMPLDASNGHPSGHHAASAGEQHHQSHSGQGKKEPAMQMEVRSPPRPRARPQEVEGKETVVHASHSRHTSDTTKSVSTSEDDGDGKVKKHKTETKTHDSSSSSSYKSFTNVFHYVISGDMQHSDNGAPFADGHIEWSHTPVDAAALAIEAQIGRPILRPARANVCNRRFPWKGKQYTAVDRDQRFDDPWPREALDEVSKAALDLHNQERARYGLVPLQWNAELANMAACWADLKAYGHSEDHYCASGENIAMGAGDTCYGNPLQGMKNAIMSFLDEDRNWAREAHLADDDGHWTQIVWKDTRFVGCAVSQRKGLAQSYSHSDGATMYVVCEYYPSGNVQGQFEHQVPRVKPLPRLRSQCSANEVHTRR